MDQITPKLDMPKFLVAIHEYLVLVGSDQDGSDLDELSLRITKTLIDDVLKANKEAVW